MSASIHVLDRLIEVVRDETEALRTDPAFDIHISIMRKQRRLLELHHMRPEPVAFARMKTLRSALEENGLELSARLEVSRKIADMVLGMVREDVRDGTYGTYGAKAEGR